MTGVQSARELAQQKLASVLPRRWTHVQAVGVRAAEFAGAAGDDADVLVAAAWLHDIGYAPDIAEKGTGFHPLDGARFLRSIGFDERVVQLVAHHSCAHLEADERGLAVELEDEFPRDPVAPHDLLLYADMTTGPDGQRLSVQERLDEIGRRYEPGDPVYRFIQKARQEIMAVVQRVDMRLSEAPLGAAVPVAASQTRPAVASGGRRSPGTVARDR
jgi:putative nucleotidyltransferase with HDIG domain